MYIAFIKGTSCDVVPPYSNRASTYPARTHLERQDLNKYQPIPDPHRAETNDSTLTPRSLLTTLVFRVQITP